MPKRENLTTRYWKEKVNYGGEIVTRAARRRDLENIAKQRAPGDPERQRRMVEAYEVGADQAERDERRRGEMRELARE